jgi:hypothetical protein
MASRLAEAHILAQERLRALAGRAVGAAWAGLPGYNEGDVDEFLTKAVPIVRAAQQQSVTLTDAYVARAIGQRPAGVDPDDIIGANARGGIAPEDVYRRPFVTVWTALARGTLWADAVSEGATRATAAAEMDVQLASRGTFAALQAAQRIRGYERVADGGACAFCQAVNGAFVKDAFAMGLHPGCGCTLSPVYGTGKVIVTPIPDTVAVRDHGELGAMLTAPGDHFTKL